MSRPLRVLRVGVRVDLDRDRTSEIREHEADDAAAWVDTHAAVAAGREVFVSAQFFAVYSDHAQPSLGITLSWVTLSTQRDVTDDLVRLAESVYADACSTELADMRIAGRDVDREADHEAEAVIEVADDLRDRIVLSPITTSGTQRAWRIEQRASGQGSTSPRRIA